MCLPPTGQIEFEANGITTFTTVKKITRTMKTENMKRLKVILKMKQMNSASFVPGFMWKCHNS